MRSLVLALLVGWGSIAAADPAVVQGRVTDILARPIANARVYVTTHGSAPIPTTTDADGRYSVEVAPGQHDVVIAFGKVYVFRTVDVAAATTLDITIELDTQGGEVIKVEDRMRPEPTTPAAPRLDTQRPPPYSDEAIARDAWARAWLLLDVDETGHVTRLKLLKAPGFDLDAIAIDTAFRLHFDPALDAQGKPMKTYIVWSMEWPSHDWLVQGAGTALRLPRSLQVRGRRVADANEEASDRGLDVPSYPLASGIPGSHAFASVPCAGSGPLNLEAWNTTYRDCSRPDLRAAETLPWITPKTAVAAIATLKAAEHELDLRAVVPPGSRVPPLVATAITGGLAIALVGGYQRYIHYATADTNDPQTHRDNVAARDRWAKASIVLSGAVVVSGGVTLFLWNRHQSKRSFSVQPASSGATASFGMAF